MSAQPLKQTIRGLLLLAVLAGGCVQTTPGHRIQPAGGVLPRIEPWNFQGGPGVCVVTPHYLVYSTLSERDTLLRIGRLMEGALSAYHAVAPDVRLDGRPMTCYLFANRAQWADFTRTHTGEDSAIYLRVNRGGYAVGDWYVAYYIGDIGTWSVAAHEGWHQFVARHLRGRLPPFLEEGLACLFEQVEWEGDLPAWDLSQNTARLNSLSAAVDGGHLYPLSQLVRMHAGQVVGKPSAEIEAFYAESWAFARFLWDGRQEANRAKLRQLLADAANSDRYSDRSRTAMPSPLWNPSSAKPLLEHYFEADLDEIDREFHDYMRVLAEQSAARHPGL